MEELASKLVEYSAKKVLDIYSERLVNSRRSGTDFKAITKDAISNYGMQLLKSCAQVRSILRPQEPVLVRKVFVPLDLKVSRPSQARSVSTTTLSTTLTSIVKNDRHMVISGTGGSGKTTVLRSLAIDALARCTTLPVFIQLRDTKPSYEAIFDTIISTLTFYQLRLTREQLNSLLFNGGVTLLLDGVDELSREDQVRFRSQIVIFSQHYSKTEIIITSRPDDDLGMFIGFSQGHILPLDKARAIELARGLPFDDFIKDRFVEQLESDLYEKYVDLAGVPLLLSVMLLTFSRSSIDTVGHHFYRNAFDVMWQGHDWLKMSYKREHACKLRYQNFVDSLGVLSLCSYAWDQDPQRRGAGYFVSSDVQRLFSEQKPLTSYFGVPDFDTHDFLQDLSKILCILVQEGQQYSYSHRTFQEYYSAYLLSKVPQYMIDDGARNRVMLRAKSDMVAMYMWQIDRERMERLFILPFVLDLRARLGYDGRVGKSVLLQFCQLAFKRILFHGTGNTVLEDPLGLRSAVAFIAQVYRSERSMILQIEPIPYKMKRSLRLSNKSGYNSPIELTAESYSDNLDDIITASMQNGVDLPDVLELVLAVPEYLSQRQKPHARTGLFGGAERSFATSDIFGMSSQNQMDDSRDKL